MYRWKVYFKSHGEDIYLGTVTTEVNRESAEKFQARERWGNDTYKVELCTEKL